MTVSKHSDRDQDGVEVTCSITAAAVTLLTVVSVKVVLVMDSVTTAGLEAVTPLGWDKLLLILDLQGKNISLALG